MAPAESITVPLRLTAGDAFAASATPSPPYDDEAWGHTLTLIAAGLRFAVPGVLADGVVTFSVAAANWPAGRYQWHYSVNDGASRHTLATGAIDVTPDTSAAFDPRTHARRTLDAIEAYLQNSDYSAARTRIADRELQTIPIPELLTLRDKYRAEVRTEEVAAGLRPVARILTRF
jgi:hypothetical protein